MPEPRGQGSRNDEALRGFLPSALADEPVLVGMLPGESKKLANGVCVDYWDAGIVCLTPTNLDTGADSVLLSCGIHGNETAPMELVDGLFTQILNGEINLRARCLLVLGNPAAAKQQQRFIDENLNRLFCAAHRHANPASLEVERARIIEQCTQRFFQATPGARCHYDLHTAIRRSRHEKFAVYPYLHDQDYSHRQLQFLSYCGIEAVLMFHQPSTTYSYYTSSQFGAEAFTVELGRVKPFGENDHSRFEQMRRALTELLQGKLPELPAEKDLQIYEVIEEVIKQSDDLRFTFADDAENFTAFPADTVLAQDQGLSYRTAVDGECIVFPHQGVPPGQRALLVVAPTTLKTGEQDGQ